MNPMDIINGLGGIEDGFVMDAAAFRQGTGKLRSVAKKRFWLLAAVVALALLLVGCTVVYVVTGAAGMRNAGIETSFPQTRLRTIWKT